MVTSRHELHGPRWQHAHGLPSQTWHPLLLRALSGIPDVHTGDSVWWHCDLIHAVAPVENQQGWGNVM